MVIAYTVALEIARLDTLPSVSRPFPWANPVAVGINLWKFWYRKQALLAEIEASSRRKIILSR
jgi:hypothetical protein